MQLRAHSEITQRTITPLAERTHIPRCSIAIFFLKLIFSQYLGCSSWTCCAQVYKNYDRMTVNGDNENDDVNSESYDEKQYDGNFKEVRRQWKQWSPPGLGFLTTVTNFLVRLTGILCAIYRTYKILFCLREFCRSTTCRWVIAILLSRLMQIFLWHCQCSSYRLMSRFSSRCSHSSPSPCCCSCFKCWCSWWREIDEPPFEKRGSCNHAICILGVRSRWDGWLYGCTFWSQVNNLTGEKIFASILAGHSWMLKRSEQSNSNLWESRRQRFPPTSSRALAVRH